MSNDTIYREDALNSIYKLKKTVTKQDVLSYCDGLFDALESIQDLPSADRPKGEWIDRSGGIEGAWNYCSVCGEQAIDLYDFCPNCGADMREKEDEYCGTCRFELYCPEMCEGCCEWDSHYEPKDEVKLCRECEEYAGDGMYCASNYLVYDFDTCKDEPRTKRSR